MKVSKKLLTGLLCISLLGSTAQSLCSETKKEVSQYKGWKCVLGMFVSAKTKVLSAIATVPAVAIVGLAANVATCAIIQKVTRCEPFGLTDYRPFPMPYLLFSSGLIMTAATVPLAATIGGYIASDRIYKHCQKELT